MILGVDPGGRTTGLVLRAGATPYAAELVDNDDGYVSERYLREVLGALADLYARATRVAIEGLNHPSPHLGLANVSGLIDTAQVLGAVRAACLERGWPLVVIEPGGNGSAPLASYPPELVGPREAKGTGKLRHCRSAWDIAGHGSHVGKIKQARNRV